MYYEEVKQYQTPDGCVFDDPGDAKSHFFEVYEEWLDHEITFSPRALLDGACDMEDTWTGSQKDLFAHVLKTLFIQQTKKDTADAIS